MCVFLVKAAIAQQETAQTISLWKNNMFYGAFFIFFCLTVTSAIFRNSKELNGCSKAFRNCRFSCFKPKYSIFDFYAIVDAIILIRVPDNFLSLNCDLSQGLNPLVQIGRFSDFGQ